MKAFKYLIILLLAISCTQKDLIHSQRQFSGSHLSQHLRENHQKLEPLIKHEKEYVSDEILIKFKESANKKIIDSIQYDLNLKEIRVISSPDLYLMKIMNGSSVEDVIELLKKYDAVKYSEPNYYRHID